MASRRMRLPLLFSLLFLVACGAGDSRAVGPGASADAAWTLLVYMAADDNLERAAILDVQEMASVAGAEHVNVIVQIDRGPATQKDRGFVRAPLLNLPDFHSAKRLRVEEMNVIELADLGETSTGAGETLAEFVAWGLETYPAQKIALVLWDHGGATAGFGWDWTNDHDGLTIPEIRSGVAKGLAASGRKKLDVLGFDACLMGTLEVAYELRDLADVLVASEELEPAHGWFYGAIVESLAASPSPADLGRGVVASYERVCNEKKTANLCTLSAIDLTKIDAVAAAVDTLGAEAIGAMAGDDGWRTMARARAESEQYGVAPGRLSPFSLVDVGDFAAKAPVSRAAANAVAEALGAATLASYHGPSMPGARGLSIVFPYAGATSRPSDAELAYAGREEWQGFLRDYLERQATDTGPPILSPAIARAVVGDTRAYDVSAGVTSNDVAETLGIVARKRESGTITILSAARLSNSSPAFRWNQTIDTLTDGSATTPLTMFEERQFTDASGRRVSFMVTAGRIIPADGGIAEAFEVVVYLDVPVGAPSEAEVRSIYELDEDDQLHEVSAGEVEVEQGDRYEPLLWAFDANDDEVWIPSGVSISLDDEDLIELGKGAAPAGEYLVGILAIDHAGNEAEQATPITIP
jgi:hypothetical protein